MAKYEYDPFGEELRASGRRIAHEQPLRYQTKFFDKDTELSHFGFRHYTATLGRFINRDPVEEPGRWRQFVGLRYGNHNPFYGAHKLGGSWLAEFQTRQDTLTQNTSLPHTTEAVGVGIYKNINLPVGEVGTKKYSANANNTGHIGQGGKQTPDWYPLVTPPGSPSPYNRDENLYIYAGNDPVNGYDAYGLFTEKDMAKFLAWNTNEHGKKYIENLKNIKDAGWQIKKFEYCNTTTASGGVADGAVNRETKVIYLRNVNGKDAVDNSVHEIKHSSQESAKTVGEFVRNEVEAFKEEAKFQRDTNRYEDIKTEFREKDIGFNESKIDKFVRDKYLKKNEDGSSINNDTEINEMKPVDSDFRFVKNVDIDKIIELYNKYKK